MRRFTLLLAALMTLVMGFAQWKTMVPASVKQFMNEQSTRQRVMDFGGREALSMFQPIYAPSKMINGVEMADAFIDISSPAIISSLKANGVIVNCEFDGFITAQVPVAKLEEISRLPGVIDVEMSRLLEQCTDSTLKVTHAGQVLNGPDYGLPQAYDGSGIIIGVIDNGFDYQHSAFKSTEDPTKTRIVRVYDPENATGHPVTLDGSSLPGSVFMGEQIDTLTTDWTETHGTHTTSIAAGRHMNGYGGMAPGAEIVLCVSRNLNLGLSEVEVANCIKYIYSYADSVGKPCVISVSVSTPHGPHDGNDRVSKAVAQLSGPGRIFVIAAGNTAANNWYCRGPVTINKPLNMLIGYTTSGKADNGYYYRSMWFDTWYRDKNVRPVIKFHIFDKWNKRIVWESDMISTYTVIDASEFSDYYQPNPAVDSVGNMEALISLNSSGKYQLACSFHNLRCTDNYVDDSGTTISRYQIGVTILAPKLKYPRQPDSCYIDSWICTQRGLRMEYTSYVNVDKITEDGDTITERVYNYYAQPSDLCCIGSYAVHDSIISAGAYTARNTYYSLFNGTTYTTTDRIGYIYGRSSYQKEGYGPTGKALPTVIAPGVNVVAAGSRYSYFAKGSEWTVMRDSTGCYWGVMTGTSMAAPTVAGIIAQWLQINPELSPSQIKDIIAETAIKDAITQSASGYKCGPNGRIDAMAGVRYLLGPLEPEVKPGDVNGDGEIDVDDVTNLIDYLLDTTQTDLNIDLNNADFNQNGEVDIDDVIALIDYLLA